MRVIVFLLSCMSVCGMAQDAVDGAAKSFPVAAIDAMVTDAIAQRRLPGAVVAVGHRGNVVFKKAYGHRQLQPTLEQMTVDTMFDLASLTKPIATATSVMVLIDQGKVSLDDPVIKHLPEFESHDKQDVTIRHLLLHTSGLIPDNAMSEYRGTRTDTVRNWMNQELLSPPGTRFRYSDVGFLVLGELIERVSDMPLDEFATQHVFAPLKMNETFFKPPESFHDRCATTQTRAGQWMRGTVHDPRAHAIGGVGGHAGLFSTTDDLVRYATAMVRGGRMNRKNEIESIRVLSPESFGMMTAAYAVPGRKSDSSSLRGLGWDKRSGYSSNRGGSMTESAFGHGGFTGTAMWIDPGLELFVVFLSNRVHPDGKGSVNVLAGEIGTVAANWAIARPAND